jgi:hypothetical protein
VHGSHPGRVYLTIGALFVLLAGCTTVSTGVPSRANPGTLPPLAPIPSPTTTAAPVTVPSGPPPYASSVTPLPADVRAKMTGVSWRPGCPVSLDDLRLLTLSYWGFDGAPHTGLLVVHRDHADKIAGAFNYFYNLRFPIERMQLADDFGGDDNASMAANNTVGFLCREVDGHPGTFSQHSYGWAIDINPVQNPWVRGSDVRPPAGLAYVDRTKQEPGMIHDGDAVVAVFKSLGWKWGGLFRTAKDYQHFSATGL